MTVSYRGYRKSTGQRRKARTFALFSAPTADGTGKAAPPDTFGELSVALLDGRSGRVLWQSAGSSGLTDLPDLVGDVVKRLKSDFPR